MVTATTVLWGALLLLSGFILNHVIVRIIPKSPDYVLKEVCTKCQELRDSERESFQKELSDMKQELIAVRKALHDIRDRLPAKA